MAASAYKDAPEFRLRKVDSSDLPDELFDDEEATLEQAGIVDGQLLWLEEGRQPLKGQISIRFQLYTPLASEGMQDYGLCSPAFHLSNWYRRPSEDQEFEISTLFTMDVSMYMKLGDLKQLLLKQPAIATLVVQYTHRLTVISLTLPYCACGMTINYSEKTDFPSKSSPS